MLSYTDEFLPIGIAKIVQTSERISSYLNISQRVLPIFALANIYIFSQSMLNWNIISSEKNINVKGLFNSPGL